MRYAAGLLVDNQQVLLCLRGEVWDIPGTPVRDDEYPLDALIRTLAVTLDVRLTEVDATPLGDDLPVQRGTAASVEVAAWAVRSWRGDPRTGSWYALHQTLDLALAHPAYLSLVSSALTGPTPSATIVRRTRARQ